MSDRVASMLAPVYAMVTGLIVLLHLPTAVAVVCLAPLVVFVPGYVLVLALGVPARSDVPGRRAALAVALSLAWVALGGLVLNALFSLTTPVWTAWLVGVTYLSSVPAFLRHALDWPPPDAADAPVPPVARRGRRIPPAAAATTVVAVLSVAGAATLTEVSARNAYEIPVTQLSLLPAASGGPMLQLVVSNLSIRPERLRLTIDDGGGHPSTLPLTIRSMKTWIGAVPRPRRSLTISLTRPGAASPFSHVTWTSPAASGATPSGTLLSRVRRGASASGRGGARCGTTLGPVSAAAAHRRPAGTRGGTCRTRRHPGPAARPQSSPRPIR